MSKYRNIDIGRLADRFRVLGNSNRIKILMKLMPYYRPGEPCCSVEEAAACIGELARDLNIGLSTVSHHIKELSRAGLIETVRCGQSIRCRIDTRVLKELQQFLGAE